MTTAASPLLSADPKATVIFEATKDGKLRASYAGWSDPHVFLPGEGVEVVNRGGKVQVFRVKKLSRAHAVATVNQEVARHEDELALYEGLPADKVATLAISILETAGVLRITDDPVKPFDPDGEENYGSRW